MKLSVVVVVRLYLLGIALAGMWMVSCAGRRVVLEAESSKGYIIEISVDYLDDGIVRLLYYDVFDRDREIFCRGDMFSEAFFDLRSPGEGDIGLYETRDGNVISVYNPARPDVLLLIVDVETRVAWPTVDDYGPDLFDEVDEALGRLRVDLSNENLRLQR